MNNVHNFNAYAEAKHKRFIPSAVPLANNADAMLLHNLNSPLTFKVWERPLWYEGRTGTKFDNTKHKGLVRMLDDKPVCLNVVRDTYKVVQNDELFNAIHDGLSKTLSRADFASAQIKDRVSYGGAVCFREYIFPDIAVVSPEDDKIAFRVIVQNGFGTGAIKLYAGAIDFFCTNGLILGEYSSTYAKHTSGVTLGRFTKAVEASVDIFWKNRDMYTKLRQHKVQSDEMVQEWFQEQFSERLGMKLYRQYLIEKASRNGGGSLWAVYSAMTHFASHNSGEFGLRNTVNDHEASTMISRENQVHSAQKNIYTLAA